jgi:glyoxylase-like metal-dependent hydrolase (beta-lactamase superfamily II)
LAQVELGDRTIDVIPTPGHNSTHVAFYDRNTGLFLSGDFLLPGRILVDDIDEYRASAQRVADFVRTRPITHVLGAHIEMNQEEGLFPWGSTHHPHEHGLALTKEDLLSLPETLKHFNGFYTEHGKWVIIHPNRQLMAMGAAAVLALGALAWLAQRFFRRRRAARASGA